MKNQKGMSMIELMVVIVVLGIFAAMIGGAFSGDGAKAVSLVNTMKNLGAGAQRFKTDTSCYPSSLVSLVNRPGTADTVATWCNGVTAYTQWKGPYMEPMMADTTNKFLRVPDIAENATIGIVRYTSAAAAAAPTVATNNDAAAQMPTGGAAPLATAIAAMPRSTHTWLIAVSNVPYDLAKEVVNKCNGDVDPTTLPAFTKCVMGTDSTAAAANGGNSTIYYNFQQSRVG